MKLFFTLLSVAVDCLLNRLSFLVHKHCINIQLDVLFSIAGLLPSQYATHEGHTFVLECQA